MTDLRKDIAKIYLLLLKIREKETGKIAGVRCYESARIFYNVLKAFGYDVELVNGRYILPEKDGMRHSWVEQIVDCYGTSLLIETTPHLFFPDLNFQELVEKMVISPNDSRRKKYETIRDDDFLQILKHYGESIDSQLIENYSSLIIKLWRKAGALRTRNTQETT